MSAIRFLNRVRFYGWSCVGILLLMGTAGCPARTLTIERDKYINTGSSFKGSPLTLDIVSVFPSDLAGDRLKYNSLLKPGKDNSITSKDWFEHKPTPQSGKDPESHKERFWLGEKQILSYTVDKPGEIWGVKKGDEIRGAKLQPKGVDGKFETANIPKHGIFDRNSVIYVFGKFTDGRNNVLETKPAVFHEVGDYTDEIKIRITGGGIENRSERVYGKDNNKDGFRD